MKKRITTSILTVLALAIIFIACKKEEPQTIIVQEKRGYICENNSCKYVDDGAQYVTLLDCKSECADKRVGTAIVKVTFAYQLSYNIEIGLALSSSDLAVGAFIDSKSDAGTSQFGNPVSKVVELNKSNLAPGTYYYRIYICRYSPSTGNYCETKSGLITVKPGESATAEVAL